MWSGRARTGRGGWVGDPVVCGWGGAVWLLLRVTRVRSMPLPRTRSAVFLVPDKVAVNGPKSPPLRAYLLVGETSEQPRQRWDLPERYRDLCHTRCGTGSAAHRGKVLTVCGSALRVSLAETANAA